MSTFFRASRRTTYKTQPKQSNNSPTMTTVNPDVPRSVFDERNGNKFGMRNSNFERYARESVQWAGAWNLWIYLTFQY